MEIVEDADLYEPLVVTPQEQKSSWRLKYLRAELPSKSQHRGQRFCESSDMNFWNF